MKIPVILGIIATILVSFVVGSGFYISTLNNTDDPIPTPTPNPDSQLTLNDLFALSNGTIGFKVTLIEGESGILEAVFVNDTKYLWSEGSTESNTILKDQSKTWSKNVGSLSEGSKVEVFLQTKSISVNSTTIVSKVPDTTPELLDYYYDVYSGVGLFEEGVWAIATSKNPLTQLPISSFPQSYWSLMQQNITSRATNQDFISILISRGDKPTGGYGIAIESFSWLESYPVKFRFAVNITDPGENVLVTQALTNPMVLVPLGKLSPGEYKIEVNVVWFIQNFDDQGNPEYQPVMTFKEIVWTHNLTITTTNGIIPTATFEISVNNSDFPDLILAVDLTQVITKETAKRITDNVFVHVKGENTLYQMNSIIFNENEIVAEYTWGYSQEDMNHIFEVNVDLQKLTIEVIHCL